MYLVAMMPCQGGLEDSELKRLAAELGTTPYELRLSLNAGSPAVVLTTADVKAAESAVSAIARQGHRGICCNRLTTVPSSQMTPLREFEFGPDGLVADRVNQDLCPYSDVAALLRATHRTSTETTEQVKQRQITPGMALATGGLILSKTTTKSVTTSTSKHEQVLYIFRHSQPRAWLLRERSAVYTALGRAMGPSSFQNFVATIERLRERCPQAQYDERLMSNRPIRGVANGIAATDLYASILAQFLRAP